MKAPGDIKAIIEQYASHGWTLRRIMLSPRSIDSFGAELMALAANAGIIAAENEGLWFSRRTLADREAWELRRLSGSPFALVAVLEDVLSDKEREDILSGLEQRMFDGSHQEPTSH